MKNEKIKYFILSGGVILASLFCVTFAHAVGSTNFQIQILAVCGNDVQEWNEDCDGEDMGVGTCITEGFNSGVLSCNADCTYNTDECVIILPPAATSTNNNNGGGGSAVYIPPQVTLTTVFFSGLAYPGSTVTLLKDAQPAATTVAGPDAKFSFSLSGLSGGSYVFSLFTEDNLNRRSSLLTFPANLNSKTMTEISGAFLSPTISVDKSEVKQGENIIISGQTAPNADITIAIVSDQTNEIIYKKTQANVLGAYSIVFNTGSMAETQYLVKSQATYGGEVTIYSRAVSFTIGQKNILKEEKKEWLRGDLNEDWQVNLIDFSIGAYWYKKELNEKITLKESQVLNGDKKIDLVDFSIMAYNWTG